MESSAQEPPEEHTEQHEETGVEPNAQPLYEFSPEHLQSNNPVIQPPPAPVTQVLPLENTAQAAPEALPVDEDAVRKGLVYPPPPSFYQNMQPLATPPLLPPVPSQLLQPRYGQPGQPAPVNPGVVPPQTQGQHIPRQPQTPQGFYPPTYPPPYERRPPVRKSRRWLWITLSIVGVVLLLTCGLCSWAAYNFLAPAVQGVSGSLNVVNDYYGDLQTKNYAAAFGDINTQYELSGLTETKFAQEASTRESQYGPILSFTPGQPAYASTPSGGFDFTRFTISVDVKRAKLSYTTTLYVREIGNNWKITNFDSV